MNDNQEKPRYTIERNPTKTENAFAVIDTHVTPQGGDNTPQGGDNTPEDRIVSWHATPSEAVQAIEALTGQRELPGIPERSFDYGTSPALDVMAGDKQLHEAQSEAEVTTDPHAMTRDAIRILRAALVESAASTGEEELAGAIADVAAMFVLSQNQLAVQLERIANATVAQTKLLCHVYSGSVSQKVIDDAVRGLGE